MASFSNLSMAEKPTIYYVFDPLCGWCYGFTPVMIEFKEKNAEKYHFKIISGGMVTGARVHPITHMAEYISNAHERVERLTGVKFGEKFLKETLYDSSVIMDSELPARALILFAELQPQKAFEFAHDVQRALYYEGKNLSDKKVYGPIAAKYGVDPKYFIEKLKEEKYRREAYDQFQLSGNMDVSGYPSIVVESGNTTKKITSGFVTYKELQEALNN